MILPTVWPLQLNLPIRCFSVIFPTLNILLVIFQVYKILFSFRVAQTLSPPKSISTLGVLKSSLVITDFLANLLTFKLLAISVQQSQVFHFGCLNAFIGNRMRSSCFSQCFGISLIKSSDQSFVFWSA